MANSTGTGGFKKGQSGNPSGRPPKGRALTEILEKAGSAKIEYKGKSISGKKALADMLWQAALNGLVDMPDGSKLTIAADDWFAVVQFLYKHIDGPPKGELDLTSKGEQLTGLVINIPDDGDDDGD